MGKVLKVVATIGIAIGIAVLAAPTGGLSIGLAAALHVSAIVASAVIATGLSLVAGLAMQVLSGKPSTQGQAATPTTFRQSITNARIIYGKRRAGGVIVFFQPKQVGKVHYRYFVVAIAGHHCAGANAFYLNDQVVTVDPGTGKVTSGDYANAAWLWFEPGAADAPANATFVAECAPKWTANHQGRGVAKLYAKFQMTDAVIQAGMPNMTVEVLGKDDVRDPRTNARGYSRNAVAVFYDWLAMPRSEGGFGAYADEIPDDDWLSAQCNVADEQIPLRAGGSEERYAFDSMIEVGAAPSEVRQTFVTCCAGTYAYSGGKHLMRPGYWVPVSATLHEDDLSGAITLPLLADESSIANQVSGTFIDPSSLYQPQPVPTRSVGNSLVLNDDGTSILNDDGQPILNDGLSYDDIRQADYDLPHITSHPRGQRILEIMLRRSNCEMQVTWPMNIVGLTVAAMDTVQLATARYRLSNYAWTTTSWGLSTDFGVVVGLKEDRPENYDWNVGMELLPEEVPELDRASPIGAARGSYRVLSQTNLYPLSSDAHSIMIASYTVVIDNGRQLNLAASSIVNLDPGVTYAVFFDPSSPQYVLNEDGNYALNEDGSRVGNEQDSGVFHAEAAPAIDEMASSANVFLGWCTTANADGSYPASADTQPGGYGGSGSNGTLVQDKRNVNGGEP